MKRSIGFISCFAFVFLFFSAYPTLAATIHVPTNQPTIQAGVDTGENGDLVLVSPGSYVENGDGESFGEYSCADNDYEGLTDEEEPACAPAVTGILVNELFYDPAGTDGGYEYIILYNATEEEIDLTGWEIQWGGTDFTYGIYSIPSVALGSGEGLLIGGDLMSQVPDITYNFNFQNGPASDGVRITDGSQTVIDTVIYGSPNESGLPGDGGLDPYPDEMCAPDPMSGKALVRDALHTDTDDCSIDFTAANPIGDCWDDDVDGFDDEACGGTDCDDSDPTVYPEAQEICDGKDTDCDGSSPWWEADEDEDGWMTCEGDCDDSNPMVHPEAEELCDGKDNDCDGAIPADEADFDEDGQLICEGDCDDSNPATSLGALEICDGEDNDCDGSPEAVEVDTDRDGWMICAGDCDDSESSIYPGAVDPDPCDGVDHTCDGLGDEADDDGDGHMICEGDCDDSNKKTYPGATEKADLRDNDCDGSILDDPVIIASGLAIMAKRIIDLLNTDPDQEPSPEPKPNPHQGKGACGCALYQAPSRSGLTASALVYLMPVAFIGIMKRWVRR